MTAQKRVIIVSRCAWTLYNFRLSLAQYLQDAGYHVTCVGAPSGDYGTKIESSGLTFVPIRLKGDSVSLFSNVTTMMDLRRIYRKLKPDIVHQFTIKPVLMGSLALRFLPPTVCVNTITGLGQVFHADTARPLRWMVDTLYAACLPESDFVFFQKEEDRRAFSDKPWLQNISTQVVPGSGVDLKKYAYSPDLPRAQGPGVRFAMITRLLKEKGVLEFCEAARAVKQSSPAASFHLIGAQDALNDSTVTHAMLKPFIDDGSIITHGQVDNVERVMTESDVIVLPSYYPEGVPKVLLEAGSVGRPIITTDLPGCRDAVLPNESALLVKPKNVPDLVGAMCALIENPEKLASMGAAGRRHVEKHFDQKIVFEATLHAYERLLTPKLAKISSAF